MADPFEVYRALEAQIALAKVRSQELATLLGTTSRWPIAYYDYVSV